MVSVPALIVVELEFSLQLARLVTAVVLLSLNLAVAVQLPVLLSGIVKGQFTDTLLRVLATGV